MNRPLRVLTIGHSYVLATNRAIAREVAEDENFDVTVAAPSFFHGDLRPIRIEPEPRSSKIRIFPLRARLTQYIHVFTYHQTDLNRLITEGDFDVVHSWEEPYICAGYQIARSLAHQQARFCFRTAQSYVKQYPPPFGFFERRVLRRAQGWIAGASLVERAMLEKGYPAELGRVLNLAVDLSAFQPLTEDERHDVIQSLGITPPVIGFVGRLTEAKGIRILLSAMEPLTKYNWNLLFLGSGECKREIEEWARQRGIAERVKIILAKHSEVSRYLGVMDLLVAPSQTRKNWREQFGRMIIEAFACSVPVIGSDSGEIPYVIGDAGYILPEADISAWTETINCLLNDPGKRNYLASRGLKRVDRFSVTNAALKYRNYYRWLSEQQPHPSIDSGQHRKALMPSGSKAEARARPRIS